ncbi:MULTISPECIES: hypothetical protein [Streptomyces]|uniref:DUF3344 domain-containing protein n=1 Tax=Streptomyces albus (strain ATCC 21838 / DSM 41398 / FERM P-419 / JCM 4703 / NBRC 107858) TaxID=1081613 RepID=A0A0B5EW51_STRA4|nr:hypothetical protein [Streptomyces sp. SCSIO ZS0520]AJE83460.1 hypothetical protein SLNWT_3084 [Streptomyces albus]AOU77769.1 hypothetical protein SLNHY_3078 [Streptomyces albus]AYN33530.1 hypothetical protein DUI70_3029 [Streptomyces albus]
MRRPLGPVLRRSLLPLLLLAASPAALPAPATAAPPTPAPAESPGLAFAPRYHSVQRGGLVRAANSAVSCRDSGPTAKLCPAVRGGRAGGVNGDFDMFYTDVDRDPNTYNSSRGEVRLPAGSRVSYARLYWGGNLLAGEQKPPKDNGRVLFAEPGGAYREVRADSRTGHRVAGGMDAFQASADVTRLVRAAGPGQYTVAQVNVASGRSRAGTWGGWTLVVAYENPREPRRELGLWDGFAAFDAAHPSHTVPLTGVAVPKGARGTAGFVAYNGDRGTRGDSLALSTGRGPGVLLSGPADPADDLLNSTVSGPGGARTARTPAYDNTLGYDSDVLDASAALAPGGDRLGARFTSRRDAAWLGAFFLAADAGR